MAAAAAAPLRPHERGAAAALMAGAFRSSPSYTWMMCGAGERRREALLERLFERNIALQAGWCMRRHGGCGESEGCSGGGGGDAGSQLQCAFLLTPSDAPNIGLIEMLRGGLISVACAMGARATLRMLQLKDNHERIHSEVMAGRRYIALERMAVRRELRGRGIGGRALKSALAEVADASGLPVVLSTQERRNVRFYERHGFVVQREWEFPVGATPPVHNWIMVREPRP